MPSGTNPSNNPPIPNNGNITVDDISRKLETMNNLLSGIVDVFEKNGRQNSPSSFYSQLTLEKAKRGQSGDIFKYNQKAWSELTKSEKSNFVKSPFKDELAAERKKERDNKAILNNSSSTAAERTEAKKKIKESQARQKEIKKQQRERYENQEEIYKENDRFSDKSIEERWNNMNDSQKADYGGDKQRYFEAEKFEQKYIENSEANLKASRMIANSGIGHTKVGGALQSALSKVQTVRDIKRFAMKMQNGGAQRIARGLFGRGGAGKAVSKVLSVISRAAAAAAGPLMVVAGIVVAAIAIFKMWGEAVAAVARYKAETANIDTDVLNAQYDFYDKTLQANADYQSASIQSQGQVKLKEIDVVGQNLLEATKIVAEQYAKAHEIAANYAFKGINKSAYEAAYAAMDTAADIRKYEEHKAARAQELSAVKAAAGAQMGLAAAQKSAAKTMAREAYDAEIARSARNREKLGERQNWVAASGEETRDMLTPEAVTSAENATKAIVNRHQVRNQAVNDKYSKYTKGADFWEAEMMNQMEATESLQKMGDSLLNRRITEELGKASLATKQMVANARIQATAAGINANLAQKQASIQQQRADIIIDAALQIKKTWLAFAEKLEEYVGEFDKTTNDLGINLGFTDKAELMQFKKSMFPIIEKKVNKWGKTVEDAAKAQSAYIEGTGRNKMMSGNDYGMVMALNLMTGDDTTAVSLLTNMEIFNADIKNTSERVAKWSNKVNRSGLNARKYMKDVAKNLKLAEKYNFVDGTEGLMRMQKWAQQVRFNMDSLGSMLDKIRNGTYEDAILESGQLQVLGGFAAINSDPFGMIYDAWADAEAFAKRINGMIKGMGKIDEKTGETTFTMAERMMITQIAKTVGKSVEDLIGEAMARNKADKVREYLKTNNIGETWDEDFLENVINRASFNEETGKWQVAVQTRNNKGELVFEPKDIDQLNPENPDDFLMPETFEDEVEHHLQEIVAMLDQMKGEELAEKTNLAEATYDDVVKAFEERTKIAMQQYLTHKEEYVNEAKQGMKMATEAWQGYINQWKAGNDQVDTEVRKIGNIAENLNDNLKALKKQVESGRIALSKVGAGGVAPDALAKGVEKEEDNRKKLATTMVKNFSSSGDAADNAFKFGAPGNTREQNIAAYQSSNVLMHSMEYMSTKRGRYAAGEKHDKEVGGYVVEDYLNMSEADKAQFEADMYKYMREAYKEEYGKDFTGEFDAMINATMRPIVQSTQSPFSDLFNNTMPRINEIESSFSDYNMPMAYLDENEAEIDSILSGQNTPANLTANFGGKFKFNMDKSSNNGIDELFNNPILMRSVAFETVNQFMTTANGGRKEMYKTRGYVG